MPSSTVASASFLANSGSRATSHISIMAVVDSISATSLVRRAP